jgi:hypothetical protein
VEAVHLLAEIKKGGQSKAARRGNYSQTVQEALHTKGENKCAHHGQIFLLVLIARDWSSKVTLNFFIHRPCCKKANGYLPGILRVTQIRHITQVNVGIEIGKSFLYRYKKSTNKNVNRVVQELFGQQIRNTVHTGAQVSNSGTVRL